MKVICIVGLPGSGKTYLANKIKSEDNSFVIFDDISLHHKNDSLSLIDAIKNKRNVIIIDVNFCKKYVRDLAEIKIKSIDDKAFIEWIYFENNPDKCKINIKYRSEVFGDNRNVISDIDYYSKNYQIADHGYIKIINN